jgi:hypothetical protein
MADILTLEVSKQLELYEAAFVPTANNATSNGLSSRRWSMVYAASGDYTGGVSVSGRLIVDSNQVDFRQLPTSDPAVPGRLYRFGSGIFVSL